MNLTAISAVAAFAIGFGSAWTFQQGNIDHAEKQRLEQAQAGERELHAMEQKRSSQIIDAQNSARVRESKLRNDADTARNAVTGLRNAIASTVQAAASDPAACHERTNAISVVLAECVAEYQSLGSVADRINSDRVMLMDSWPR